MNKPAFPPKPPINEWAEDLCIRSYKVASRCSIGVVDDLKRIPSVALEIMSDPEMKKILEQRAILSSADKESMNAYLDWIVECVVLWADLVEKNSSSPLPKEALELILKLNPEARTIQHPTLQ